MGIYMYPSAILMQAVCRPVPIDGGIKKVAEGFLEKRRDELIRNASGLIVCFISALRAGVFSGATYYSGDRATLVIWFQ